MLVFFANLPDEVPRNNRLAVKHNMSREAVGDLSEFLRSLGHNVSKDARTIFKTPRKKLQSDCFVHLGLIKNLMRKLKFGLEKNVRYFELQVNIDGTPIFNSSISGNVILCMNLKCKGNCDNTLMRLDHTDNFSRNVCLWFHFLAFGDS